MSLIVGERGGVQGVCMEGRGDDTHHERVHHFGRGHVREISGTHDQESGPHALWHRAKNIPRLDGNAGRSNDASTGKEIKNLGLE